MTGFSGLAHQSCYSFLLFCAAQSGCNHALKLAVMKDAFVNDESIVKRVECPRKRLGLRFIDMCSAFLWVHLVKCFIKHISQ